jgi:DNA-binding transcriptional LysR family regulator
MDRLEAMAILLRVADRGSFSAASRELGLPLATVSRKVGELERHLGTRLLLRSTRRVTLSDAGAAYVAKVRRILADIEETERIASGELQAPRGDLTLTAPVLFGRLHILPIVTGFLAAFPEIDVRLLLSDRNLQLIDDHIDMAVRIGTLPDSSMIATRVGTMRTVVCASPALLAERGTPTSPQVLSAWPCVQFETPSRLSSWRFRGRAGPADVEVPIRPRLAVSSAEAAVWAATQGTGVTRVLHYQAADALRAGVLRIVLADFEVEPVPIHLIHAARGALPLKMRAFLDAALPRLRADLARLSQAPDEPTET